MFPKVKTYVDDEIARLVRELQVDQPDTEEYGTVLERLSKLQKIRQEEKPDRPSSDTLFMAATNLVGVWMILHHEDLNVITSKAMSFIRFR